jgi:hypothetical protein
MHFTRAIASSDACPAGKYYAVRIPNARLLHTRRRCAVDPAHLSDKGREGSFESPSSVTLTQEANRWVEVGHGKGKRARFARRTLLK